MARKRNRIPRPAGDGGIARRGAKSWRLAASAGYDEQGQRVRVYRTVRAENEAEAREALRELVREVETGSSADPKNETVGSLLSRWLQHVECNGDLRPHTLRRYKQLVDGHIVPAIGTVKLAKLRAAHVQRVVDQMAAKGLSPTTRHHAYRVLSAALKRAVRWQLLPVNVAEAVDAPRAKRRDLDVPEPHELARLLEVAKQSAELAPITVLVACGLRRSELLGVRWRDVTMEGENPALRIEQTLQRVPVTGEKRSELRFDKSKTDRSRRSVALPQFAVEVLRRHHKEQTERRVRLGEAWQGAADRADDLVFDNGLGSPRDPDAFGAFVRRVMRTAELGRARLHDLRHGFATLLLAQGVHPAIASAALGHSSPGFTMSVYQHVLENMGRQAADAVQQALRGANPVPIEEHEHRS